MRFPVVRKAQPGLLSRNREQVWDSRGAVPNCCEEFQLVLELQPVLIMSLFTLNRLYIESAAVYMYMCSSILGEDLSNILV